MEIYKKWFGKRLIELREQAGYRTQDKFAEAVGVKNASASRWETGDSFPDEKHFKKICKVLRVTPERFLQFREIDKEQRFGSTFADAIALLSAFEKAGHDTQEAVLSLLDLTAVVLPQSAPPTGSLGQE